MENLPKPASVLTFREFTGTSTPFSGTVSGVTRFLTSFVMFALCSTGKDILSRREKVATAPSLKAKIGDSYFKTNDKK